MEFSPLKLLAKDLEDLKILSAHLQDALMPLSAMAYDSTQKTFSLLANRHCWEHLPIIHEGENLYHRVHSGICFKDVMQVHHRGFHPKGPLRTLNFLMAEASGKDRLHLVFSGDAYIQLKINQIHCHLSDLGIPWPTRKRPMHIHEHIQAYKQNTHNAQH